MEPNKNGEIPIPESLRILPTDDKKTKERKRKTIKSIKYKNHKAQLEKIEADKQQEWQSFQNKISKKRTYGYMSSVALKQKSAIATPDTDRVMTKTEKIQKISKSEKCDVIIS